MTICDTCVHRDWCDQLDSGWSCAQSSVGRAGGGYEPAAEPDTAADTRGE